MSLSRRSELWDEPRREAHRATGRVGYTKRHRVWTDERREAHRSRRPYERAPKVAEVDTLDHAALWLKLAPDNATRYVVAAVLRMSDTPADFPPPPWYARTGESLPTWAIHAAKLVAPKLRYPGEVLPRLTPAQIEAAVNARQAIEAFVILATAVEPPTIPSEA